MAKPATVPEFCTDLVNVTAPDPTQETDGYTTSYQPGAYEHNYLFGWASEWFAWINTLISSESAGTLNWSGSFIHSFTSRILITAAAGNNAITATGGTTTTTVGGSGLAGAGGAATGAGGTGGIGNVAVGGQASGSAGIGGDGLVGNGGNFIPSVNTDNGTAGAGGNYDGGDTRTNGTASTAGYGIVVKGGKLRNAANSAYQQGTLTPAAYIAAGIGSDGVDGKLGTVIAARDESAGAFGSVANGSFSLDADPELSRIRLQKGATETASAQDYRGVLSHVNLPAVNIAITPANGTPTALGASYNGVYTLSYPSATVLRVTFGKSGTAYSLASTNYVCQVSTDGAGASVWKVQTRNAAYVELSLINTTSGSAITVNTGGQSGELLNLTILGAWA